MGYGHGGPSYYLTVQEPDGTRVEISSGASRLRTATPGDKIVVHYYREETMPFDSVPDAPLNGNVGVWLAFAIAEAALFVTAAVCYALEVDLPIIGTAISAVINSRT